MGYAEDGKEIMNNIVLGTGVGASATGLYYLAKKLRKRFEEQLAKNAPPAPDYQSVALDVPDLDAAPQKIAFDAYSVATPLATGGASAILAAALSDKKTKLRNAAIAGAVGAGAGAGLNTKPVHEFMGKHIPSSIFPFLEPVLGKSWFDRGSGYNAWNAALNVGGAGLGVAGGKALYDMSVAPQLEAEKKKEQYNNVEDARKQYFNELLQDDKSDKKKEKKASVNEFLDEAYNAYAEKKAAWTDYIPSANPTKWPVLKTFFHDLPTLYATLGVAATLGGGAIGGKYMYDKTRSESAAKNMAKALAAKERMKNTLPVWIDPQELAQVKDVAKAKEPTAEGV
jgi:hypothetical protein